MKELHVKIADKNYERLLQIQEKNALGSISAAINWVVATDRLVDFIKSGLKDIHKISTVGRDMEVKAVTQVGKCQVCSYVGEVTKGPYFEHELESDKTFETELFLCPKHLVNNRRDI